MAELLTPWPDAEVVLLDLLEPIAPTVTSTPPTITTPLIRVVRTGGSDDGITDSPVVEVTCIGATRTESWQLSEQCRQVILASPNTVVGGALIDNAATFTPPQQIPDPDLDKRSVTTNFVLAWRRPRS
ncbi:MAG: hypothetical protein J0I34_07275 [Pseudonocardia sp.]|uniref:phage tail termination protein n=1 Tax=Actinomycetes TaxID=1760 RepID=UPI00086CD0F8|nr:MULTISPECIES: hypothetical protein [Actinomycetes]MBN9108568.1 hypothetical protein [Pseudonocardia sp.]ODU27448.1 MAG: hypothetical protein ABS80_03465 [Pseudonocardia sp. SCN 72-51]ODV07790.1 MAG: hypothetical protein ABT15_06855 [Pseudonocardia sp. SCN 73-27]